MYRHELSDRTWEILEPLVPKPKPGPGRKRLDNRRVLNGIVYVLKTGCAWADVPRRYGSPTTCWRRLKEWTANGTWEQIWRTLLGYLDRQGRLGWDKVFLDGMFVRAIRGGTKIGKSIRGKGSKVMAIVDGNGLPLGLYLDEARPHEIRFAESTVATIRVPRPVGRPRTRPHELIADKAYDSQAFREALARRGIKVTIPVVERRKRKHPKLGRPHRRALTYRERWKVERAFAWMDNCRRLLVRYDRAVEHYQAYCFLAFILWCLDRILK